MKNSLPALTVFIMVSAALGGCFGDGGSPASTTGASGTGGGSGNGTSGGGGTGGTGGTGGGGGSGGTNDSAPPVAAFSLGNGTDNLTSGTDLIFNGSASSDPMGGNLTFAWDFGDNKTGSGQVTNHTFAKEGNYTVTLTVTAESSGLNDTESMLLVVAKGARSALSFTDPSSDGTTNYHDLRTISISDDGEMLVVAFTVGVLQPAEDNELVVCYNLFLKPKGATAEQRYELYSNLGDYYIYGYPAPAGDLAGAAVEKVGTGYKLSMTFASLKLEEKSFPLDVRMESRTSECAAVGGNTNANGPGKLDVAPNTGMYTYG